MNNIDNFLVDSLDNTFVLIASKLDEENENEEVNQSKSYWEVADEDKKGPSPLRGIPQSLIHQINRLTGSIATLNEKHGSKTIALMFYASIKERNAVQDYFNELEE